MISFSKTDNANNIIAYVNCYLEADNKTFHILEAWTEEPYQGKGYFKAILSDIIAYCKKNSYTQITLTAAQLSNISNNELVEIYKKCGFISSECNKYRMYLNIT